DGAGGRHLGIDAAIGMAETAQQGCRNVEVADASAGFHVGGGAAYDALDDPRTRLRADCEFLAEKIEFPPGGPALYIEIAAKAQRIERTPHHAFDRADRGKIDDRDHLLGDVGKAVALSGE